MRHTSKPVQYAKHRGKDNPMKTYNVTWAPSFTDTIEAGSAEEAAQKFAEQFDSMIGGYQIAKDLNYCLIAKEITQ
jgi:hypothetical protein